MTITVKDAVLTAAEMLGIDKGVKSYLQGESNPDGAEDVERLLRCYQTVENEIALDYIPLVREDVVVTTDGKIAFTSLTSTATRILCVEDEWGNSIKYKLFPDRLETAVGKARITYAYAPAQKTISGTSEFKSSVSLRLFGYGMAAEYALASGELTAAGVWNIKYKDALRAAYRARPCKKIRSRRWI